jgi:hypothetical protein
MTTAFRSNRLADQMFRAIPAAIMTKPPTTSKILGFRGQLLMMSGA